MRNWIMDRLTLNRLFVAIALVMFAAVMLDVLSSRKWVDTWMPNLVAELVGALITVALVNFILRHQQRPLLESAARRIDTPLLSLFQVALNQRTRTQEISKTEDPKRVLDEWISELEKKLPERDWLNYWAANLDSIRAALGPVRDRYDRIFSEPLLAALDDFDLWATRAPNDIRWTASLDNAVNSKYPTDTWKPVFLDHFEALRVRLGALVDAYAAEFERPFLLPDELWEAARAHRHSQKAGLPLPWPEPG